jgi:hypothetical protein
VTRDAHGTVPRWRGSGDRDNPRGDAADVNGAVEAAARASRPGARSRRAQGCTSRWHPDYTDEFTEFLASPAPFRQ